MPDPILPSFPSPDPGLNSAQEQGQGTNTALNDQINQSQEIGIAVFDDPTLNIEGILGGLPVAERNQEYFVTVKEAGSTEPEIIGKTQFFVSYLVDSDLNISKPSEDSVALLNLTQNFEQESNARVRVDQGTVLNPQLAGLHNIHAVGTPEPILLTQIGKGPLEYVTTMSFVQKDQLGGIPGVLVADYSMYYDFHGNYNKIKITFESHSGTRAGAKDYRDVRLYQTIQDTQTGSATNFSASLDYFATDEGTYFDTLVINSSSIEGKSRIKIRGHVGISLVSSSVHDIYLSYDQEQLGYGNAYNFNPNNYLVPLKARVIRKRGGVETPIYNSPIKTLNTFNNPLTGSSVSFTDDVYTAVANACWIQIETDYFPVEENDEYYFDLILPQETSASVGVPAWDDSALFPAILNAQPQFAYRTYEYFSGYFQVINETVAGDNEFLINVTGVTASYFTQDNTPTIYNNTSSYFVGANNIVDDTSGENFCFVTASTYLSQFYGGQYIQVDPGTEDYNLLNANGSPSSSLIFTDENANTGKYTSLNFGFNPVRLPFVPVPGDFIRFEYSPQKTHKILRASTLQGTLILKLAGNIDETYVLDNFVIYRIINNGQFIILDVEKNNDIGINQAFTGIISTEFPSTALNEKGDSLIFDLKQANIIEE